MNEACGICSIDLTFDNALEYLEDLAAHFSCLRYCELEEEHADIAIYLLALAHALTRAKGMSQLNLWIGLHKELFRHFCFFRNFKSSFYTEDQIDESHDYGVFWVESEHLEKNLTCVDFLQGLQCFQSQSWLAPAVKVRHFFYDLEVIFSISLKLSLHQIALVSLCLHKVLPLSEKVGNNLAVAAKSQKHRGQQGRDCRVTWHQEYVSAFDQRIEELELQRIDANHGVSLVQ